MEALEEIGKFHFRDAGAVPAAAGPNPLESAAAQPLPSETISLIDAKRIWQDKVAAEDIEVKTVGIKLLPVTELIEFLGAERELHTITRPEMARFYDHLAKRGLTRSTLNNRQSYLAGKRILHLGNGFRLRAQGRQCRRRSRQRFDGGEAQAQKIWLPGLYLGSGSSTLRA
jgi:hypothetical protein